MQRILGYMRRAITEFDLIENGDRIAVGISGGKDSVVMLKGLVMLKRFIGIDYEIVAVTLDPYFGGVSGDYSEIQKLCDELSVEYHILETQIAEIIFNVRKEKSPCSLCARMRRGALHDAAKSLNCNKIALGHNYNDAVETFVMNLTIEGRLGCFSPKSYLSRKDLTMIRPLVFAPEKEVVKAARKNKLPIVKSKCPADKHTKREDTKIKLAELDRADHGFSDRLFGALRKSGLDGWGYKNKEIPVTEE